MTPTTVPSPPDGYVRVPEAARRLGCTTVELYHQIDGGRVQARRDAHGRVVVPTSELERLSPP